MATTDRDWSRRPSNLHVLLLLGPALADGEFALGAPLSLRVLLARASAALNIVVKPCDSFVVNDTMMFLMLHLCLDFFLNAFSPKSINA